MSRCKYRIAVGGGHYSCFKTMGDPPCEECGSGETPTDESVCYRTVCSVKDGYRVWWTFALELESKDADGSSNWHCKVLIDDEPTSLNFDIRVNGDDGPSRGQIGGALNERMFNVIEGLMSSGSSVMPL